MMGVLIFFYEHTEISETKLQVCTTLANGDVIVTIGNLPLGILKPTCPA